MKKGGDHRNKHSNNSKNKLTTDLQSWDSNSVLINEGKKPMSGKIKKNLMKEDRKKKQEKLAKELADDENEQQNKYDIIHSKISMPKIIDKILIPDDANTGGLRTVFAKESKEDVDKRRAASRIAFSKVPPGDLGFARHDPESISSIIIDFPHRPPWDENTTPEELDRNERAYFKDYLQKIYSTFNVDRLNKFEHNLEVWRQLWRVMERSDILLLLADIRQPLTNFPQALYKYIQDVLKKPLILVLTKIDLVPYKLVENWKRWFISHYPDITVIPFTSHPHSQSEATDEVSDVNIKRPKRRIKGDRLSKPSGADLILQAVSNMIQVGELGGDGDINDVRNGNGESLDSRRRYPRELDDICSVNEGKDDEGRKLKKGMKSALFEVLEEESRSSSRSANRSVNEVEETATETAVIIPSQLLHSHTTTTPLPSPSLSPSLSRDVKTNTDVMLIRTTTAGSHPSDAVSTSSQNSRQSTYNSSSHEHEHTLSPPLTNSHQDQENTRHITSDVVTPTFPILTSEDIRSGKKSTSDNLHPFQTPLLTTNTVRTNTSQHHAHVYPRCRGGVVVLGTIGCPNEGKSSLINAIAGKKVVGVSKTPGHTKHLQTIVLNSSVTICDCPGLVFPAVDTPLPLQILSGHVNIAQVRETYSTLGYVGARMPLDAVYGLHPSDAPDTLPVDPATGECMWSGYAIAAAWARKRNYHTYGTQLDTHRAGNEILRDITSGRIVFAMEPPSDG
eukprot:gene6178-12513_t